MVLLLPAKGQPGRVEVPAKQVADAGAGAPRNQMGIDHVARHEQHLGDYRRVDNKRWLEHGLLQD